MHEIRLERSPDPLAGFKGTTCKGMDGTYIGWEGRASGRKRGGGYGKGREGERGKNHTGTFSSTSSPDHKQL